MRKFLTLLALALLLPGCKTVEGIKVETFDNNTRLRLINDSGKDLHNVDGICKLQMKYVEYNSWPTVWNPQIIGVKFKVNFPEWKQGEVHTRPNIYSNQITRIFFSGSSKEGSWWINQRLDTVSAPK